MLVYRVEMPCGMGPYWACKDNGDEYKYHKSLCEEHNSDSYYWPPCSSDFETINKSDVFGFDSIDSLNNWFGEHLPKILKEGGTIKEFIVDKKYVRMGDSGRQLIFRKDKARAAELEMLA